VRGRSRLRGSLARAACGWVSEGVTPFLPDHRQYGNNHRRVSGPIIQAAVRASRARWAGLLDSRITFGFSFPLTSVAPNDLTHSNN
jgi:hypothetical protein